MNFIRYLKNIFILFMLFLIAPPKYSYASGYYININDSLTSIKKSISTNGLNNKIFNEYLFCLLNCKTDIDNELKFVNSLQQNENQKLLLGFVYQKKNNFEKAFKILSSLYKTVPNILEYYEHLVKSAKVVHKLAYVKNVSQKTYKQNNYYSFAYGLINYNTGNYKEASDIFNKLINSGFKNSNVYYWNAYALRGMGNYEKALIQLKQAKKFIPHKKYLPKILNAEGSLFYLSGNYDDAQKYYESAEKIAKQYQNNIELAKSLVNLAIISDDLGNISNARKLFYEALKIAKEINSIELQAFVNSELGVSYTYDNHIVDAEKHYKKSLKLYKILKDENRLSILYSNLGKIYSTLFNYKFALESFNKGLKFSKQNKRSKILNLTGIADVYANLSNYSKALEYYNKAKKISKEINEISLQAEIEEDLGILEFNLKLPAKALEYFNKAKKISKENQNIIFAADLFHKFGVIYYVLDSLNLAEKYLKDSKKLTIESGDVYNRLLVELDLANIYLRKNKLHKAKTLLEKVGKLCREYKLKHLLSKQKLLMAELVRKRGNYFLVEKYLKGVITLFKQIGDRNMLIEANYQLGLFYLKKRNIEKAKQYLTNAKQILEDVSRPLFSKQEVQIPYFSGFNKIYTTLAELYLSEKKADIAFEIIDAQRSRNTVQHLNNLKIISKIKNKNELKRLYELEWMVNSGIYSTVERRTIEDEFKKLKKKLISKEPVIQKYLGFNKYRKLQEIQAGLDTGEHFISYFTTDKFTQIFYLTKKSFQTKKIIISSDSISALIKNISPFYKNQEIRKEFYFNQDLFSFNVAASNKFYELLLKPILKEVKRNANLIFSLPPEMVKIPMGFLVTEYNKNDSPYNYNNVKYLIENFNISYIPSGNTLISLKGNGFSHYNKSLLMGDPKNTNSNFVYNIRGALLEDKKTLRDINITSLDYSKDEIEGINNILENTEVFLSKDATENNFKKFASVSNIIHLSTHSFLFNNQPLIIFSNSYKDSSDGLLERGEIAQLELNADMVVLSSCKSGLGKIDLSEGVLGMQKSFLDAGANSVVVSLWDVNDKATSILMKAFYKFLSEGHDKTSALKMAKKMFIKNESSNPYYWAAFILTGNTSKLNIKRTSFSTDSYLFILFLILFLFLYLFYRRKKLTTFR